MPLFPRFFPRWWLLVALVAAAFVAGLGYGRARQALTLQETGREVGAANYAGGRHWLIVPEHNPRSYQWLAETEQMLTHGEWRVRQVDYENAPGGRAVMSASPFRWWLGLLARIDGALTNHSSGESVERAALWSGPLLHLLLLAGTTAYVAWRFGGAPTAFAAVAIAALFPLAGDFVPAVPDDHGLAVAVAFASALLLAGGLRGHRRDFIASGLVGGLGLWLDVSVMVPVLAALALGALVLALVERVTTKPGQAAPSPALPWDRWALAGALTGVLGYYAEYYPSDADLSLRYNHPAYALAWIGAGLALVLAHHWAARSLQRNARTLTLAVAALAGLAALPAAMRFAGSYTLFGAGTQAGRLGNLAESPVAANVTAWLRSDGLSLQAFATFVPLILLVPVVIAAWRKDAAPAARRLAVIGSVALVVVTGFACAQLQWWGGVQLVLVAVIAGAWPAKSWSVWLVAAFALIPGLVQVVGTAKSRDETQLTRLELEGLIERDIAHWIADHAAGPGAIVLVPPERTPAFNFFGGLRGLGTPNAENEAGVAATIRIMSSGTAEEAHAQLDQRAVTHVVLLSWDHEIDEFVRLAYHNPKDTLMGALRNWALPPWLKPLSYQLPRMPGMEDQQAAVFEVTDNINSAVSMTRMADYAMETRNEALAGAVNDSLKSLPNNLGALAARAQIEKALGNEAEFTKTLEAAAQIVTNKRDQLLPWEQRVTLAVVLAQGNKADLATAQVRRCVTDLNETRLRSLSTGSLYRLLVLARAYNVTVPAELRAYALTLLPAEARERL